MEVELVVMADWGAEMEEKVVLVVLVVEAVMVAERVVWVEVMVGNRFLMTRVRTCRVCNIHHDVQTKLRCHDPAASVLLGCNSNLEGSCHQTNLRWGDHRYHHSKRAAERAAETNLCRRAPS